MLLSCLHLEPHPLEDGGADLMDFSLGWHHEARVCGWATNVPWELGEDNEPFCSHVVMCEMGLIPLTLQDYCDEQRK